ncbi:MULTISPECIES: DNA-processing protein DprA [unclassified Microbacterium]|uniref:DNA-processing protein DprA n=1 Tax=unclassified Microbacterium TaxID=2609290 RepID=UPI000CFBA7DC|nr:MULTISPECIES: DNA-processing protein DprA [unclassified Microbacterium]PQZ53147.1 DNA-protecting protein DprA [Microbacterium sp. MYb43]PQZ74689.1 DNA-protecting protein DprA [Microbacterium sp. MYb40]PRB18777.1 DNA-protecting protein DprA [Microbacterium sp. MYb54]PRB23637.1 DNA-protecting protein DprA [Microbacterium sp. MYb50]PRB63354.1 DNA-protecting protein DprA [Microbacterium sp. MYb24]
MSTSTLPQTDALHARAAISTIIEPGDAVAGTLIDALGPVAAYDAITGNGLRAALQDAGVDERTATASAAQWAPRISSSAIAENLASLERAGTTLIDPDTIPALADLGTQRPVALYVRGDASLLTTPRPITVVGARASTGYGEAITAEIVSDLAAHKVTILSGAAYGIDGTAHRAALAAGIPTVAVVACGVERRYPAGHSELINRISEHGAVISEVPMGTAPTRWRFLARNRVLAALSRVTVVTEAGYRSGSISTADHAVLLGRRLGAVPGPLTSVASSGCHRLIRDHKATLITSAQDIMALVDGE